MATQVIMPKTGMSQETGTIVKWLLAEGDHVEKGQPLLEIMTDKINMEVESPASGTLRILALPDQVVPVTQVIAYIVQADEHIPSKDDAFSDTAESPPEPQAPSAQATEPAGPTHIFPARNRPAATPTARRMAKQLGLELGSITGTGPRGTITRADVMRVAEGTAGPTAAPVVTSTMTRIVRSIPLIGRRRIIAERMQQSVSQAPQIALTIEVDMTQAHSACHEASITALLVSVVAHTLPNHPLLNSTLHDNRILLLEDIHIGVAVSTEGGLIVPVVRNADRKPLDVIHAEIKHLAERARSSRLTLDEVSGGTFTISNLGMYGIPQFRAIINPPEAAILAVGAVIKRPVVIDDGIHIRPIMTLTASADHRILDGVAVAAFLQELKASLETAS